MFELLNFSLCIFAMTCLDAGDWKSSLLSLTSFMSYIVLMTRLDKTKVGGYVRVIDQIARKSVKPFVIIFILLLGFLIAFRNRSIENNSSFDTIDHLNGSLPHTFFQIYFMMAGDHQTENMGIDTLTEANLMTFVLYFVFMFLISTLTFNIFTGIAISEIQGLIDDSNIETMKEKIDYIYEGSYSIPMLLEEIGCVRRLKKKVFGKVSRIFELGKWIEKMLFFCGSCRDRLLTCLGTLRFKCFPRKEEEKRATTVAPDEQSSIKKSNATQADFIDDKYIEYFEEIENRTKNLEEKLFMNNKSLSETIEDRSKNMEDKLDLINKSISETIENRTKSLEEKFETRSKNLEEKLDQILNNNKISETIENRTKILEDKLDKLTSLLSQR